HDKVGAAIAETILTRLRFSRKQVEEIVTAVRYHMQFKDAPKMRRSTLRRMLARPTFNLELELHRLDCLASNGDLSCYNFLVEEVKAIVNQPTLPPPLVRGRDLLKLGMEPGPAMGALLAEIRERQLDGDFRDRAEALSWVRKRLSGQSAIGDSKDGKQES
ncbi:MAG: CCA tRNA nucleotidyltransferase, partial [Verrucomicrobiae bacterium]|nr:CCA tRNA nucleotidyltransferase [Verrucomicrobiae bacterium]